MSVELATGSAAGQSETTFRRTRGPAKAPAAGRLVLICEDCGRAIRGSGAAFAAVDLRDAHAAAHGAHKAAWSLLHVACAPEVVKPLNPYFRIWAERMDSVDGLLDAMATLSRHRWFAATDWGSLVRRILADTDKAIGDAQSRSTDNSTAPPVRDRSERKETTEQRRQALVANPDDPRHGSLYAYARLGCRCDRCKAANTAQARREKSPNNQQRLAGAVTGTGDVDSAAEHTASGARP